MYVNSFNNISVQGVPFEKSHKEMAVAIIQGIFDPMFGKSKCV